MLSRSVLMWILIVILILLAVPLLGALTTSSYMVGPASLWIAMLALFLVVVIVSIVRSVSRKHERDRAA